MEIYKATQLDVKGDKSLWEKQNLDGVGKVLIVEDSYYDGIVEMIEELKKNNARVSYKGKLPVGKERDF